MIKIDIQKAYDSVEWLFMKYLMLEMEFPSQFVDWIVSCLSSVFYVVNVNGEMTEPFQARITQLLNTTLDVKSLISLSYVLLMI